MVINRKRAIIKRKKERIIWLAYFITTVRQTLFHYFCPNGYLLVVQQIYHIGGVFQFILGGSLLRLMTNSQILVGQQLKNSYRKLHLKSR